MDKVLITLVVPSLQEEFDVLLPNFLTIKEIITLLTEAVSDITQKMYVPSGCEVLCRREPDMLLDATYTAAEYRMEHGERLYLF